MSQIVSPPVDSRETVEIAPGVFVPESRVDEVMTFICLNPEVAEAIDEIRLERTAIDPLTDDLPTAVPFQFQSELEWKLAMLLMDRSIANTQRADRVRSVAPWAMFYGS